MAAGVHWFVLFVRSCQEKTVSSRLVAQGIENYIPIRRELRQWSDRKVWKDRILMPRTVFVHCTERERLQILKDNLYADYYMMDRLTKHPAIVPEGQMELFKRVVGGSAAPVEFHPSDAFAPGDMVRVIEGPLKDMECEITSIKNHSYICVRLGLLGVALTEISASSVEKI